MKKYNGISTTCTIQAANTINEALASVRTLLLIDKEATIIWPFHFLGEI